MKRLMISAMSSSAGKTVLSCALMAALKARGYTVQGFKCGPDYIDTMFHARILGVPGRNLDCFLQGEAAMRAALLRSTADVGVVEGAMGFYDGIAGTSDNSAWEIARLTETPVILTVSPKGAGLTLAAQIRGMLGFRPESGIRAILLTNCTPGSAARLAPMLEKETGLPVLGFLPPMEEAVLPSRHLGLLTPDEINGLSERFQKIAEALERHADLSRLLALAEESQTEPSPAPPLPPPVCRIAVARDEAFCFLYEDGLDALRQAGAELVFFSPVHDDALPPEIDGLYLCGGYPELFAAALADNESMRRSIRSALEGRLPAVAECGGFLYLQEELEDGKGNAFPMCGALPGKGRRTEHLQRFGYQHLVAEEDSLLFRRGEQIPAHEFHYWDSTQPGTALLSRKPDGRSWRCGYVSPVLYAAFPHLHFGGEIPLARRFVDACRENALTFPR